MSRTTYKYKLRLLSIYTNIMLFIICSFITCGITYLILNWNKYINCDSYVNSYTITSILSIIYNIKFISIIGEQTIKYYILNLFTLLINFGLIIWGSIQYSHKGCLNDDIFLWIYTILLTTLQFVFTYMCIIINYTMIYKQNKLQNSAIDTSAYIIEINIIPVNKFIDDQIPVDIIATPINDQLPVIIATPINDI